MGASNPATLTILGSLVLSSLIPAGPVPKAVAGAGDLDNVGVVARVLQQLQGVNLLMAELMYGSGLRLLECCRLRIKDTDLDRRQLVVRQGKGDKDRVVMLPGSVIERLREQLARRETRVTAAAQ